MTREVERMQVAVNGEPQVVLQIQAGFGAQVAAQVLQPKTHGTQQYEGAEPRPELTAVSDDRIVDDDLLQQGQEPHQHLPEHRQRNAQSQRTPVGSDMRGEISLASSEWMNWALAFPGSRCPGRSRLRQRVTIHWDGQAEGGRVAGVVLVVATDHVPRSRRIRQHALHEIVEIRRVRESGN